jgi:hypothetical protein
MNCHWTEKVSLLIDGELSHDEAAGVARHMLTCAVCRSAHDDFLAFRTQLTAYRADPETLSARSALAHILSSRPAPALGGRRAASRRRVLAAGLFGGFAPARAAALALVALCVLVAGVVFVLTSRRDATHLAVAPSDNNSQIAPAAADAANGDGAARGPADNASNGGQPQAADVEIKREAVASGAANSERRRLAPDASRGRREAARARVEAAARRRLRGAPGSEASIAAISPPAASASEGALVELMPAALGREFLIDTTSKTTRHVEQAQLLLRSFRNSRLARDKRGASDLAYDRQRSQKLLYRNIVLRREAASKGDLPVEKVLSSLEPILIDIANLPDRPARDDVRVIRERMQRKNIVAMLQISAAR